MRRQRGFTLMEVVVTVAVFGVFLLIIVQLTMDMRANEAKYPVNFMTHPEVGGVMARLRKDVLDAMYYPTDFQGYTQSNKTLILYTLRQTGFAETVVYDFRTRGEAHRRSYNATQLIADWVARGTPSFDIGSYSLKNGRDAVRIRAFDNQGKLAIDEILLPRAHN